MSFDKIIILVFVLGGIIFVAKNFKFGVLYWFLGSGALFIAYHGWNESDPNINYGLPLIIFFMSLAIMALSLFFVDKNARAGGII